MRFGSKTLAATLAAAVALTGALATSNAQEMKFWRIGTGGAGGTYFPIGGLIANAISNPPGSRPCDKGGSCGVPGLVAIAAALSGGTEVTATPFMPVSSTPVSRGPRASFRATRAKASSPGTRRTRSV